MVPRPSAAVEGGDNWEVRYGPWAKSGAAPATVEKRKPLAPLAPAGKGDGPGPPTGF